MDMDTMAPPERSLAQNVQTHAGVGLMRYHSAPSSVLSSFIHHNEVFFIPHVDNSELAQLLSPVDESRTSVSHLNAAPADKQCAIDAPPNTKSPFSMDPVVLNGFHANRTVAHLPPARCSKSKSSIFEHIRDDQCASFHISASPIMHVDTDNYRKPEFSLPELAMPILTSSFRQSLLATTKSNLIRHSSFPANFDSGHAMDGCRTPDISGPCMQTAIENRPPDNTMGSQMQITAKSMPRVPHGNMRATLDNLRGVHFPLPSSFKGAGNPSKIEDEGKVAHTRGLESLLSINRSSLFRQSSSPSGFLSQSSFEGTLSGCEKGLLSPSSGSSSEDDRRGKESQYLTRVSGFWDEAGLGTAVFGRRKRERATEDKISNGLHVLGSIQKCPAEEETLQWSSGCHIDTSSGSLPSMDESVLCRARAKRGCATHPRSIAERVRRTKISEGMRKLQELVPNMEKQTNTATMLDEAVEYVKFLQQQVQKLSENQAKCNGMCQSKGNT